MSEINDEALIIFNWWRANLEPRTQCSPDASEEERGYQRWKQGDARALSAKLRREFYPGILLEPQVEELVKKLGFKTEKGLRLLGRILSVLGEIRYNDRNTLPQRLGEKRTGTSREDSRLMSAVRFKRLITAEGDELERALHRAVRQVGYRCNVLMFVRSMLSWTDQTRTRWSLDYFNGPSPQEMA